MQKAIFGGGCFWCLEGVFEDVKGVDDVISGYSGGRRENPSYEQVCTGATGHAEVVKIIYNENIISYEQLLDIFFQVHNPTTLNRQGADVGTQYRSVIFYIDNNQRQIAIDKIDTLNKTTFGNSIVTEVSQLDKFFEAEDYHQNYYKNNPNQGYCQMVIRPKVEKFHKTFKDLIIDLRTQ